MCPDCNKNNKITANFCIECGRDIKDCNMKTCPKCSTICGKHLIYCPTCSYNLKKSNDTKNVKICTD